MSDPSHTYRFAFGCEAPARVEPQEEVRPSNRNERENSANEESVRQKDHVSHKQYIVVEFLL
jgi:hypothetical protein